jgi:DegV family protein with EDD domain
MTIRIVTDSTADLPIEIAAAHNIEVAPAYINIGDKGYIDGVDLTRREFYENLATYDPPPTTAAASSGTFAEIYGQLSAEGATEIISLHLATELSGFMNSARLGAESAESVPVHVIDTRTISMGVGLQAIAAAEAAAAGATCAEIIAMLTDMQSRTWVYAAIDTLEFLRRSGRISLTEAGIGTLLRIKPIVKVTDGTVTTAERVRTRKRVPGHLKQLLTDMGAVEHVAILHTNALDRVQELKTDLQPLFPAGYDAIIAEVGPGIGAHVGPNGLGFACITA